MRRIQTYIAMVLLLAGLALAVAACSGGGGSSPSEPTTYTNDEYGFTITHDAQFTEGEPVSAGAAAFSVVFPDKNGARVSDRYVEAIQVFVYKLPGVVKPAQVPKMKSEFERVVQDMLSSLSNAKVVEPLTPITVNGVPGFGLKYTYTEGDTELTAVGFLLVKGTYLYQIIAQSTTENWDGLKGKLEAAAKSFTAH